VISDTVLTTTINRLRAVLGDRDRLLIRTVHGFGYRFACPVQIEQRPERPRVLRSMDPGPAPIDAG
jgi:DNA-binding winged helix-turn-helix (wHTH) protein